VIKGERLVIPEQTNPEYKALIEACWVNIVNSLHLLVKLPTPSDRPNFETILQKLTEMKNKITE
jgi:hypothetical protein